MQYLFEFTFTNWLGITMALVPGAVNLGLIYYILVHLPKNRTTNVFALLTLSMFIWQISDVMGRMVFSARVADVWDCILSVGWILIGPLCFHFALLYSRVLKDEYMRTVAYLTYAPAFLFLGLYQAHVYPHHFNYHPLWGWVNNHDESLVDELMIYYVSILMLFANVLTVYKTYKERHNKLLRFQALLITLGIAAPTLCGFITQVIFPILANRPAIPIASTIMTLFTIATVIALKRYRLFSIADLISNEHVIDTLPVTVINISDRGRINYINKAGLRLLDIDEQEVKRNTSFKKLIRFPGALQQNAFSGVIRSALNGNRVYNVETAINTSTVQKDIIISAHPIINNKRIEGALLSIRDISDLKTSHRIIRESEQMLLRSQAIARLGSWEWEIATNKVVWSDELYRIYGINRAKKEVTHDTFSNLLHPDDKDQVMAIIEHSLEVKQPFDFYHRISRPDGNERIIHTQGEIDVDNEGNITKLKGTSQDVTEQKQHEDTLQKQNKELQKINSELDKFVYSVSHDLRSPLTSMLGLLILTEEETDDPLVKERLEMIKSAVLKLDKFIVDILDYSRNARTEIDAQPVQLRKTIEEIVQYLQYLHNNTIKVAIEIEDECELWSDNSRLFVILNNLVANAFHYSDSTKQARKVTIRGRVSEHFAFISIADNGIGIDKEHQEKVFDMFFRGTTESKGSGLGLYIVKDAVEKLEGEITVTSKLGEGTCFRLIIPNLAVAGKWKQTKTMQPAG